MKTFNEFVEGVFSNHSPENKDKMLPDGTIQIRLLAGANIFDTLDKATDILMKNESAKGVRFEFTNHKMLVTRENYRTFIDVLKNHFADTGFPSKAQVQSHLDSYKRYLP